MPLLETNHSKRVLFLLFKCLIEEDTKQIVFDHCVSNLDIFFDNFTIVNSEECVKLLVGLNEIRDLNIYNRTIECLKHCGNKDDEDLLEAYISVSELKR